MVSCSGVRVEKDYDQEYNFSKLHTYAKAHAEPNGDVESPQSLVSKRIGKYLKMALDNKGFQLVDEREADFLVDYKYGSREVFVPSAIQPSAAFGFGPRYYGSGFGLGMGYHQGGYQREEIETLVVDIWDGKTKEHIWTARAETDLVADDPEKSDENFAKAITKMFEDFPPSASGK